MIIFIYGDDTFRSWQKLKEIKEKFKLKVDQTGSTIDVMDSEGFDMSKLRENLMSPSLFTKQRMIILKNVLAILAKQKKQQQEMIEIISNDSDNTLVFWEDLGDKELEKKLRKSDIFVALLKTKYAQEFKKMTPSNLQLWIKNRIDELGGSIEPSGLQILITLVGNDLWRLDNEIQKLVLYTKNGEIKNSDLRDFVQEKLEDNIWQFTDALAREHKPVALKLLNDQLKTGSSHLELLNRMIWQFRVYLLIKSCLEKSVLTSSEIAKQLGIHPFVVQKALPVVKNFEFVQLKDIHGRLLELDKQFKTSQTDPELLLEKFIINL